MKRHPKIEFGILGAVIIGWGLLLSHDNEVYLHASRIPDSATQQTVSMRWKDVTVYITASDARFLHYSGYVEVCMVAIAALIIIGYRRSKS